MNDGRLFLTTVHLQNSKISEILLVNWLTIFLKKSRHVKNLYRKSTLR